MVLLGIHELLSIISIIGLKFLCLGHRKNTFRSFTSLKLCLNIICIKSIKSVFRADKQRVPRLVEAYTLLAIYENQNVSYVDTVLKILALYFNSILYCVTRSIYAGHEKYQNSKTHNKLYQCETPDYTLCKSRCPFK